MERKYFERTEAINDMLAQKNVAGLRDVLVGIINRDPTFATTRFEEALSVFQNEVGEIYENNISLTNEIRKEKNEWDKSYHKMLLAWLAQNFCEDRIHEIKEVGKTVYENEYTFGKDEAANFTGPTILENEMNLKHRGVAGVVMLLMAIALTICIVVLSIKETLLALIPTFLLIMEIVVSILQKKKKYGRE